MLREVLASGPQRAGQRIARAGRPFEVARREPHPFRLKEHSVDAALDVERPAMGAVFADVGNDGVGRRFRLQFRASLVERLTGARKPCLERIQIGVDRPRCPRLELREQSLKFFELIREFAGVILDAGQLKACRRQIGGGAVAHPGKLLDPPAQALLGEFQFGDVGRSRGIGPLPHRSAEEHEQDQQRPHRAEQHGEKRKQRDRRPFDRASAAHAAFPTRCAPSRSTRRDSPAASCARAASSCTAADNVARVSSNRPLSARAVRFD